ncbi:bifunctional nuclease family protein [Penaeicola halotolerans]|uniref:bifunctional nuclease family protein n=1 Tax=Penaeicola halotolerans TaxID=2793196 RepID=UPI001CF8DCF3|nr:bifunctional nuclease family protein [Penaeicola halotolerans]
MSKIELEILGLSSSQSQAGSFALVLGESNGNRRLPIIIGMFEAQAIAIEIEKIMPNRPMTHDLFKSFASGFGFSIDHIMISSLKEGVFYAKIVCHSGTKKLEIDARPSDAIAIAVRFNAPIFSNEQVLSEAGILFTEGEEEEGIKPEATPAKKSSSDASYKDFSLEKLHELLDQALEKEDYEVAAKIRDEINRRN